MKFLAVTDLHCSDINQSGTDKDSTGSIVKLKRILSVNLSGCDFIMNLGDTADYNGGKPQSELLSDIFGVFKSSGKPFYSIIGNHDTSIDKNEYIRLLYCPGRYYSFDCCGFKCIVIDSSINDISKPFPETEIQWDNCNVDPCQLDWLKSELRGSKTPVLVFTHAPLMLKEWDVENPHLIKNRREIIEIIENSGKVKAVFSGHYHNGCMGVRYGISHIVFGSAGKYGPDTFAVVEVSEDRLIIEGHGLNESAEFNI